MTDEERISLLASRLLDAGYFAEGGSIHIKPSHRGRLTELKARTGKTESELYNGGNPAHKKMVVFARNARKWKHADGGLLNSFDMGGDKENDALAKAIIARVNQEEAAKELREERKMSEQPLIDEHPGLDLALIYAQPGGMLSKAMAPSIAKGTVNSLVSGNTEGLLASLIPGGAQVQKLSGAVKATKPLTEAERLGVPKGLRANPKALEDPYYWGYRQWNQRYNDAVKAGNIEEAQRLRDLHFQTKAINNQLQVDGHPITLYHGNIGSDYQLVSAGYNPYSTARTAVGSSGYFAVTDPQIASTYKGPKGSIRTVYGYSKNPAVYDAEGRSWQNAFIKEVNGYKFGFKTDAGVNSAFNSGHDAVLIDNVIDYGFYTPASHPRPPFTDYVFKPGNVKLKDAVVEDDLFFEPIPIVKRDNFHNPDIRYGSGGLLRRFDEGTPGQLMLAYPGVSWGAFQEGIESAARSLRGDKQYKDTAPSVLPGSGKSDDAVALQTILQDRGYDIGTEAPDGYFWKKSTKALQRMLMDAGYDLGTSGSEGNGIDGIAGSKTKAAYEQWLGSGAWIGKQRRTGVVRDTAVVQKLDTVQSSSAVYNPVENQADSVMYSGPYNYGQHYDERFSDYVTSTGLDLSNISTEGVADNSKVDTFSPYIFDNLAQCNKESARNTLECASHITYMNLDDKRGFNIDTNGLRGNAWTMGDNMVKAGGQRLFDIFANEGAPSGDWNDSNKQKTIAFVREKAKDPEYISFLESNLQPGDVVELLYPNSTNFKKAYTETGGKHQNTHIGYVVKVGDELYIRDNVGNHTANTSRVHTRKLSSVLNGKEGDGVLITGAVRTKDALDGQQYIGGRQGRDMSAFGITPTATDNASQSRLSNDAAYRAMGAIYKNRDKILSDNNLTVDEFNRLAGLTQAVIFKETAAGELFHNQKWISKNAGLDGVVNDTNKKELNRANTVGYTVGTPIAYLASDLTGGAISGINAHLEPSAGLGSVKYQGPASSLTDKQRRQLGSGAEVKAALRSAQPEVSGVTTLYALSTSMHAVKDLLRRYAPSDIASNDDIVDQLTALAHNQGTSLIEQTLKNAKADGDWEGHMSGLLDASYGKNAMIVRGYNKTNMFSKEERAAIDQRRKEQEKSLRDRLMSRGITAQDIASMMAQRESTYTSRSSYIPQQLAQVD